MSATTNQKTKKILDRDVLLKAYELMHMAKRMAEIYDENKEIAAKYVHSTSRGHEAIQLAAAMQLKAVDFAAPYYRDESFLLGLGLTPYELMLQLMAKKDDPFSGGRTYYNHPSLRREGMPTIPHQSSATGMQAIPATGMAHAIQYLERQHDEATEGRPVVLCSLGDGSVTEGEVSEAFQMAVLKNLPIIYLIQDNDWGISATGAEMRAMNAYEFAAGFKGLRRLQANGSDFIDSFEKIKTALAHVRNRKGPVLVHASCPLLGHHTSGVRKEWYRTDDDLEIHAFGDPIPKFHKYLLANEFSENELKSLSKKAVKTAEDDFKHAVEAENPDPSDIMKHEFAPAAVTEESGERKPKGAEKVVMVDAALHAVDNILKETPEALFYGQDVGGTLGGVFREAANLAKKYGDERVFNTPIQEAYVVGSTAGMSAVGAKPIVEIQFADYIWPGMNQLVEELSKSCYLSNGQFPIQSLIRIPIGAYGGGGPYHSGSIESSVLNIRGIKVIFPSNAADMKGLMKAAFLDPNPVVCFEHKGLYWSKVPGTDEAKTFEPSDDYVIPIGKGRVVQLAEENQIEQGQSVTIITYGMGVYWAKAASQQFEGQVEIIDLRSLNPIDWELISESVKKHGRALVLTEEPLMNSFAESLAGRLNQHCFEHLDAPVKAYGALDLPAIGLNVLWEETMLPNAEKVAEEIKTLLNY